MADQKITELNSGTPVDTDIIPYVDLNTMETKKATKSSLQGATGAAATIAVGTVLTGVAGSNAIINNSGTTSAAVFDFTIPRGDTGAAGPTGPMGSVAGSDTQVQFNDGGAFGGDAGLVYNKTLDYLGVGGTIPTNTITLPSTANGIAFYNTSVQITNFEKVTMGYVSNVFGITNTRGGTGLDRAIAINTGGTQLIVASGGVDFSRTTASSNTDLFNFGGVFTQSTGTIDVLTAIFTAGQSGTAGYHGFRMNVTESSLGSGEKQLIQLSTNTVEKFSVANTGITTITNITDQDSNQILVLNGDRATPTANDEVYQSFQLSSSTGVQREMARLTIRASDVVNATEDAYYRFYLIVNGTLTEKLNLDSTSINPFTNDGLTLGKATQSYADLFLASGGVINWNNGDYTLTHSSGVITASKDFRIITANVGTSSDTVATLTSTNTFTNKRITKRTGTTTSNPTPTINTDNVDFYSITALSAGITSFSTNLSGTPTEGQTLWIAITDNGTARNITWGASFEASGTVLLPTVTVISTRLDVGFVWNTFTSKWRCVAVS